VILRHLERLAVGGLLIGLGFIGADAITHRGPRYFWWFIPFRRRPGGAWGAIVSLWRWRPALVVGLLIISVALLVALWVTVAAYRAARVERAGEWPADLPT
jgi:hypothetical protein